MEFIRGKEINNLIKLTTYLLFAVLVIGCNHKRKLFKNNFENNTSLDSFGSVFGIDVSRHQGNIDWERVSKWKNSKITFVYIKATEGSSYIDPRYYQNVQGAKNNGFLVGSYHYFRSTSSPEQQFLNFKNTVDSGVQDLIPMIDLEENNRLTTNEYNQRVEKFLSLVNEYFGKKPILYSPQRFYNKHLKNRYLSYYWNIARYHRNKMPELLDDNTITLWQFSDRSSVKGIPSLVDLNILNNKHSIDFLKY